ncbi:MAG: hypothetical protein ACE5ER_09090 [Nitrospinaceae bacterium]
MRRWMEATDTHFVDLKRDFRQRIDRVERKVEQLKALRLEDQRHSYETFVQKEWFFHTTAKNDRSFRRLFRRRGGVQSKDAVRRGAARKAG